MSKNAVGQPEKKSRKLSGGTAVRNELAELQTLSTELFLGGKRSPKPGSVISKCGVTFLSAMKLSNLLGFPDWKEKKDLHLLEKTADVKCEYQSCGIS